MSKLINDGFSVYEIDEECLSRKEKEEQKKEMEWQKKQKERTTGEDQKPRI